MEVLTREWLYSPGYMHIIGYKPNADMFSKYATRSSEAVLLEEVLIRLCSLNRQPHSYRSALHYIIGPLALILEQFLELLHEKRPEAIPIQILSYLFHEGTGLFPVTIPSPNYHPTSGPRSWDKKPVLRL
ncbi:hypothetical protein M422DRAFT_247785 [Sphaerobolus stellatus SS14]|nr:hypothetical protein M422DRAFT_247785 [Sphaerobolus stellatus SS14]